MAAGRYDFTIEQGTTVDFQIEYTDCNNTAVDLTDYQSRMQIRPFAGSSDLHLTLSSSLGTCGTGINMSGSNSLNPPTSGTLGIYISAASSSLLSWDGAAYYDLEIYSGSGACQYVVRLLEGKVKLSKEITTTP
jgi:hypothetical protein